MCGAFGLYALQFLVTPEKLVTDHFDTTVTPSLKFWVRGTAVPTAVAVYGLMNLGASGSPHPRSLLSPALAPLTHTDHRTTRGRAEGDAATKGCLALSAGVGLLYPWNAKASAGAGRV